MASLGFSLVNYSIKIFLLHIFKTYLHIQEVFMEENPGMAHKIILNNRNQGNLTGILDVISFDENTIVLDTDMGLLTIKGKDLHVNRLSLEKGEVDLSGNIDSIAYSSVTPQAKQGDSFLTKLFK